LKIEKRLIRFVTRMNWVLLAAAAVAGIILASPSFARGVVFGGVIVTVNFHLLARTLKRSLTPPHLAPVHILLLKYYLRFAISAVIIFFLITRHLVNLPGLIVGLSMVVFSIMLATILEVSKLKTKEVA